MNSVFVILLCIGLISNSASDWNYFKGSPERTNCSDFSAPDTCYLQWRVETDSALYSSPVVKNQNVYQVALEKILCVDLDTGGILWTSSVPAYNSTPALTDDKIIVATNRGISAISIEDGDFIWEYVVSERFSTIKLIDYIVSSPLIVDGKVVVGTMPYNYKVVDGFGTFDQNELYLVCLDETTGEENWYIKTNLGVLSSPCTVHGRVFAASREILLIDPETGEVLWNSERKHPYNSEKPKEERYSFDYSTPALYHGILIGGSCVMGWAMVEPRYIGWHKIVAMDQHTSDIFWEWRGEGALASSPAVCEGKVYFYSYDGMVRCLSLFDGEKLWETSISEPKEYEVKGFKIWSSPAVADNKVYIGSIEGVFYCLDALTGDVLWQYETGGPIHSSPAVILEKVLISSTDGFLYCFGIDPETYNMKAEKYLEDKIYDKAEKFFMKAKEHADTNEEIKEINASLELINSEMKDYKKRLEELSEAEFFMDKADKALWDKEFEEAKELYTKALKIYEKVDHEYGITFCEYRVDYVEKRVEYIYRGIRKPDQNYWLFIIICIGAASIFIVKYAGRRKRKKEQ